MGSLEEIPERDYVEAQLLTDPVSQTEDEESGDYGRILYRASFAEMENSYVNYDTVQWILISLLLVLVYGVGLLMLLYVPIRRYVVRQDIRTRKLYVTTNAIVYKVTRPVFVPCFGVSKREKHVLLHLVTDVVVEQGCLQSSYGISSIRVEGMAVHSRPTPGDEVRIQGLSNATLFKRIVLNAASNIRKGQRAGDDVQTTGGTEETQIFETPPQEPSGSGGRHPQHWAWRPGVAGLTSWQLLKAAPDHRQLAVPADLRFVTPSFTVRPALNHSSGRTRTHDMGTLLLHRGPVAYSPSLPAVQNRRDVNVSGEVLLRRLEGIEASMKRLEVLIESQQWDESSQ